MTTSSIQKIDSRLASLQPGTLRYQVLVALKQFRASWVELGRLLNEVVYGGDYKDAGYADFEVYCARELGLKKPTVQKLMISYNYMRKYESERLEAVEEGGRDDVVPVPDFQTVELLDRVRRRDEVPEDKLEELHRRVFDEPADGDEMDLRKELRLMLKPAAVAAENIDTVRARQRELAQLLKPARELRRRMSTSSLVPGGLRERLETALTELESLDN